MCHVHGVFSLCSFLRGVSLILLGTFFSVRAQAQTGAGSAIHPDCHNLCFETG